MDAFNFTDGGAKSRRVIALIRAKLKGRPVARELGQFFFLITE